MKRLDTYACINLDNNERMNSSSGAVFSLLAKLILADNGIVYGVEMSEDCYSAKFVGITDEKELHRLRGSKYLQAKLGDTYKQIRYNLEKGNKVLFSGTGCQVNGLKSFLGREYENLICVDVICHGVPSPKLWEKYVKYQEQQNCGKLKCINFRCKTDSWNNFGMSEIFENNNIKSLYISKDKDSYMQMFLRDYCLRPSCYKCIAKNKKMSDITIADFWGIEKVMPEMTDGNGTSLVIVRTDKGDSFFKKVETYIRKEVVSYEEGVRENPAEFRSCNRPIQRDNFFDDMDKMSFHELEIKYASPIKKSLRSRVKNRIKRYIKRCIRKISEGSISNMDYFVYMIFICEGDDNEKSTSII